MPSYYPPGLTTFQRIQKDPKYRDVYANIIRCWTALPIETHRDRLAYSALHCLMVIDDILVTIKAVDEWNSSHPDQEIDLGELELLDLRDGLERKAQMLEAEYERLKG